MRLLASTDIALRVLMLLAREPAGNHLNVEVLARELGGLSRNHLHKIVQDLNALGVTRTVRGAGGGVMLAVSPAQVLIGTLVRQLEADQPMVECFRSEPCACTLMPGCRLRGMLGDAQNSFYASLDSHTLADCLPVAVRQLETCTASEMPAKVTVIARGQSSSTRVKARPGTTQPSRNPGNDG